MARENILESHYLEESESLRSDERARELLQYIEYKIFRERHYSSIEKIIISGSQFASKFIKISVSEKDRKKLDNLLYLTGYRIAADQLYSFAILVLLTFMILGILLLVLFFSSPFIGIGLILFSFIGYFVIINWPQHQFSSMVSKASGSLVTAVIYLIIYMRLHSNLEGAISFTADNLTGYLSMDFKKMLWDVETRRYKDAREAIVSYLSLWSGINPAFVDSVLLIESSTLQKDEESKNLLLDQASERIVEGTYTQMSEYAASLREPLNTIYMVGMILPILGMVLMPLVISFVAIPDFGILMFLLYDVVLPLMVYMMLYDRIRLRPAGFPAPDISKVPDLPPPGKFRIKLGKRSIFVPSFVVGIIFLALFSPVIYYLLPLYSLNNYLGAIASTPLIFAIGAFISLTFFLGSYEQEKFIKKLYAIQDSFASVAFQIASYLSQGYPPESAVVLSQMNTKGTPIEELMREIVVNIKDLGLSLKNALFDKDIGALTRFPSPQIVAAMKVFIEATEKSSTYASKAMLYISRYFSNLSRVDKQVSTLLEEVTSGMKFEVGALGPVMAGIVVGLTTLISQVLTKLGSSLSIIHSLSTSSNLGSYAGAATAIFSIFNLSGGAISPALFQIIVGIYVIEIAIIAAYGVASINRPGDIVELMSEISKIVMMSLLIYVIVAVGVSYFFGSLGASVISVSA